MPRGLHWTQTQYDDYCRRHNTPQRNTDSEPVVEVPPKKARCKNRTEREYELMLIAEFPDANVRYEGYTLKLADGCRYTPDFAVEHLDGRVDFHEVKGAFIFSKALTKPRTAAELFPHRFVLAQKLKSGWQITNLRGKIDASTT